MATKVLQQIVGPNESPVYSYFKPGDTCYHIHNGVTVPGIVADLIVTGPQVGGDNVLYTIIADLNASPSYGSYGVGRGPYRFVPAANLSTR